MTTVLYAQPYDIEATGFYFESAEDYAKKAKANLNSDGDLIEEYEIQFIDGEAIDAALVKAVGLYHSDIPAFFEKSEEWNEDDKQRIIIAAGECGYVFDWQCTEPSAYEIDLYQFGCMQDLAEHFVDEGLFGEIPEHLQFYLDYAAIARDLSMDYAETEIAGTSLIYRCG